MYVLNLGCGFRTSARCINIDWFPPVRLKASRVGRWIAPLLLTGARRTAYDAMGDHPVIARDLRKGIPFPDASVDAVYHSHLLQALDRVAVPQFFAEVHRVLRPGGVHRIVVPDLEREVRRYLASYEKAKSTGDSSEHEAAVRNLIEQMVRREAAGTAQQHRPQRWLENRILGDARARGETQQWMWDRVSLPAELLACGFREPGIVTFETSQIDDWPGYLLDQDIVGDEHKPGSIYLEAVR